MDLDLTLIVNAGIGCLLALLVVALIGLIRS